MYRPATSDPQIRIRHCRWHSGAEF